MAYETYEDFQRKSDSLRRQQQTHGKHRGTAETVTGFLGGVAGGLLGGPGGAMAGYAAGRKLGGGLYDAVSVSPGYDPNTLAQEQLAMLQQKAYEQRLANMDYTRNAFAPANATLARLYGSESAVPLPSQNELRSGPLARYYVPGAS